MGPVLRDRASKNNKRNEFVCPQTSRKEVLADRTNIKNMNARNKIHVQKPSNLSVVGETKASIYKPDGEEKCDIKPKEKIAIYDFEIDENDPQPKKVKRKRKTVRRKKFNTAVDENDSMIDKKYSKSTKKIKKEGLSNTSEKKSLRPRTEFKYDSSSEEYDSRPRRKAEKVRSSIKEKHSTSSKSMEHDNYSAQNTELKSIDTERRSGIPAEIKELKSSTPLIVINYPVEKQKEAMTPMIVINCPAQNEELNPTMPVIEINSPSKKEHLMLADPVTVINSSTVVQLKSPVEKEQLKSLPKLRERNRAVEKKQLKSLITNTEKKSPISVKENQLKSRMLQNKENIPTHKLKTCMNLPEDTELNFSSEESRFIPYNKHQSHICPTFDSSDSVFVTKQQPNKIKSKGNLEDFTVSNFFGFDEDSEDDFPSLLSPVKKTAENLTSSIRFAVSSTPDLKLSTARTVSLPSRLELDVRCTSPTHRPYVRSTSPVLSASDNIPSSSVTASSASASSSNVPSSSEAASSGITLTVPSLESSAVTTLSSSTLIPSTVTVSSALTAPSTTTSSVSAGASAARTSEQSDTTLFMDDNLQYFTEAPRRSYGSSVRKRRDSYSGSQYTSEDDTCSKKQPKQKKKQNKKKEKIVEKWAANMSAQFEEIDSFELCVE